MKNLLIIYFVLVLSIFTGCCSRQDNIQNTQTNSKKSDFDKDPFPFGYNDGYYGYGKNFEPSLNRLDRDIENSSNYFFGY